MTKLLSIATLLALSLSAAHAQPQPVAPPPTNPTAQTSVAPTADECSKPENRTRPGCVPDKGMVRVPTPATDPAIARTPPPTGDPINRPGAAPSDQKKESPR
jgi:hypothetical protein